MGVYESSDINRTGFPKSTLKISLIRFDMNNMGFLSAQMSGLLGY